MLFFISRILMCMLSCLLPSAMHRGCMVGMGCMEGKLLLGLPMFYLVLLCCPPGDVDGSRAAAQLAVTGPNATAKTHAFNAFPVSTSPRPSPRPSLLPSPRPSPHPFPRSCLARSFDYMWRGVTRAFTRGTEVFTSMVSPALVDLVFTLPRLRVYA